MADAASFDEIVAGTDFLVWQRPVLANKGLRNYITKSSW